MTDSVSLLSREMPGNTPSLGSFPRGYIPKGIYTPHGKCPPCWDTPGNGLEELQ